jgi:3-hydroxy-9,10-secoandrosta-1,3,5(10)-triene-9,17-dione monooxygenase
MAVAGVPDGAGQRGPLVVQPEPGLCGDEMVERARALRTMLRAQQNEADAQGYYTAEVHEAIKSAGLYRAIQPKMFGGYEVDLPTFLKISVEISRGHPGSGWCYTLASSHALLVASYFPFEVQRELFGPSGDFRAPHKAPPSGTFKRVEGGYIVNGIWTYASGIPYGTHFFGGATLPPDADGGPSRWAHFIVRRDQVAILDDWGGDYSLGMQASGSHGVRLENVFVPDRHFIHADILLSSDPSGKGTCGTELHDNPMYLGVVGGAYHATFGAILTGTARASLDEYEDIMRKRALPNNPNMQRLDDPDSQRVIGKAVQLTDAAEALTIACGRHYMEQCERWKRAGKPISAEDTLRLWGMAQEACFMACEAVELMFKTAGATASNPDQKLSHYFRDIQMYLVHPSSQPRVTSMIAQTYLGLPLTLFSERGRTNTGAKGT